ncbi:mevalonate kinase [Lacticaseibacillus daqingensis]|uniref:mevalonate kinase n=1 Tax=Lacticaseibacillus daqingensis TaxID=2486014 RepID=UPI000F77689E|nr:mevalonate kinase [Lacticaseibacillus daqingensis]
MKTATGTSFAKIILIGEHAVVYGQPAIALPVPTIQLTATVTPRADHAQRVRSSYYTGALAAAALPFAGITQLVAQMLTHFDATTQGFDLTITSALPPERGMGSSAATATAVIRALYAAFDAPLTRAALLEWAGVSERAIHGNPSGLDAATTSATVPQWFVKGHAPEPIAFPTRGTLVIADTGVRGQTKAAVAQVAAALQADPARVTPLITGIGAAVKRAAHALATSDLVALGASLNASQQALATLGVSSPALERLITAARQAGALGAKLTGSGQGGCMIALAADGAHADRLIAALTDAGATSVWRHDFDESEGHA